MTLRDSVDLVDKPVAAKPKKKRAHTFAPPAWWTGEISHRVVVGRGRKRDDDERMTQAMLGERLVARYEVAGTYHPSELSRCVLGEVVPIVMAQQVSEVLAMPCPIYIARTMEEARRLQQQRDATDAMAAEVEARVRQASDVLAVEEAAMALETARAIAPAGRVAVVAKVAKVAPTDRISRARSRGGGGG
jgi:hypothetical protein